ncbi:MAG: PEGA domain-containing protein [Alphaproteobacteria bacterium]|nr:PEGA domain-containing protein [Alphaproteobacteria bacterium]
MLQLAPARQPAPASMSSQNFPTMVPEDMGAPRASEARGGGSLSQSASPTLMPEDMLDDYEPARPPPVRRLTDRPDPTIIPEEEDLAPPILAPPILAQETAPLPVPIIRGEDLLGDPRQRRRKPRPLPPLPPEPEPEPELPLEDDDVISTLELADRDGSELEAPAPVEFPTAPVPPPFSNPHPTYEDDDYDERPTETGFDEDAGVLAFEPEEADDEVELPPSPRMGRPPPSIRPSGPPPLAVHPRQEEETGGNRSMLLGIVVVLLLVIGGGVIAMNAGGEDPVEDPDGVVVADPPEDPAGVNPPVDPPKDPPVNPMTVDTPKDPPVNPMTVDAPKDPPVDTPKDPPVDTPKDPPKDPDGVVEVAPPDKPPDQPPQPATGTLSVTVTPSSASILIDGRTAGKGSVSKTLTQGRHTVAAEAKGYKTSEQRVTVGEGTKALDISLEKLSTSGIVTLYGTPGSQVWVGDRKIDTIPASIELPEGSHTFRVVTPDSTSYTVQRTIQFANPGQPVKVMLMPD